ncbi:Smr protein/MutS2 (fragment) [uncultured delta proteobacterium]|uniref:Smr protein/MutS2 n=1 Tax=uncultured delta proteobacterium TaxID=34034 RepID=A0A212J961_9DELT
MSKHDTVRSFQDLDVTRFRKAGNTPATEAPARKRPAASAAAPAIADESAMFLEAVSGTLDVSLKHTPGDADTPAPRAEKQKKHTAVLAGTPSRPQPEAAAPADPKKPPVPATPSVSDIPPESSIPKDADLFARAMGDVRPIRASGRDLAPPSRQLEPIYTKALADMDDIFSGKLEFSLEYTDEFVQGHVLGLDPLVLEKLKAGAYSPEGHVDLHGQNMEQAYATLVTFIRHAYQGGKRHLVVVTGRGKNSPGGTPVLRERVQAWFTRDPFKRVVLGFCSAKPGDGGAGALYVLLRKRKKSQGKIVWNTTPSEEELLL